MQQEKTGKPVLLTAIVIIIALVLGGAVWWLNAANENQDKKIRFLRNRIGKIESRLKAQNSGAGEF